MSQQPPPPIIPQIVHTPSPKPPSSPTSSTYSSTATEDISDSGDDLPPTIMEPSDYLTHGDLRSASREFTRERSLRKKPPHRHTPSTSVQSPPADPGVQPSYGTDDEEKKVLTKEEKVLARKKAKKVARAAKRKALKSQETPKNPRKREDRRREDEVAAVEASMAALKTSEVTEEGEREDSITVTQDRQRRRSSNTPSRPAKPRKTSSSTQGGGGGLKSPKIGADDDTPPSTIKRGGNAKHAAALAQYHVEEGIHERSNDIDSQMAALAKLEAMSAESRGGKLARGLEVLEGRLRERKQNEALKGVVDAAQERYEDEKLARFYDLK
ncbi:hypothetical protein ABW19_dt0209823 [Dactylella cylindrospora]|nr:hypothetical protein ABW19_dt0209823 [Dactylella cylindrospora]